MSKEQETLKKFKGAFETILNNTNHEQLNISFTREFAQKVIKDCDNINQALKRLEAIDSSKPSESMECLENLANYYDINYDSDDERYTTIKQALIQGRKDKEDIDLIVSKTICMEYLKESENVEEYNTYILHRNPISYNECKLTKEEFCRLKERVKCLKN